MLWINNRVMIILGLRFGFRVRVGFYTLHHSYAIVSLYCGACIYPLRRCCIGRYLSYKKLSGAIPATLGNLVKLTKL